ncbi:hypothetical protein HZA99_02635 [Candidatus Woesearchaeota archaeon]|nr:hypothetical protein [Candidatus Woesearchaeota archaeon]
MEQDTQNLADALAKMTPAERVKHLEKLAEQTKKELQERESFLKKNQELLEKQRHDMIQHSIDDDKKRLRDFEEKQKLEHQREELSKYLQEEKKNSLEGTVSSSRLPATHPVVGLYNQLQQLRDSYQEEDVAVDYARTTVLQDIRKEVVEVLRQYKEIPEEVKELADATYRLTKELLGERVQDNKKYFP